MKTGYIVLGSTHGSVSRPMWEESRKGMESLKGVLFYGSKATVFSTRDKARRAIQRTLKDLKNNGVHATREQFEIYTLTAE